MSITEGLAVYIGEGVKSGLNVNDTNFVDISGKLTSAVKRDKTLCLCPSAEHVPERLLSALELGLLYRPEEGSEERAAKAALLRNGIRVERKRIKSRKSSQKHKGETA